MNTSSTYRDGQFRIRVPPRPKGGGGAQASYGHGNGVVGSLKIFARHHISIQELLCGHGSGGKSG